MTKPVTDAVVQPDVVDLLVKQHMAIRDLFVEVDSATGPAHRVEPVQLATVWRDLRKAA